MGLSRIISTEPDAAGPEKASRCMNPGRFRVRRAPRTVNPDSHDHPRYEWEVAALAGRDSAGHVQDRVDAGQVGAGECGHGVGGGKHDQFDAAALRLPVDLVHDG